MVPMSCTNGDETRLRSPLASPFSLISYAFPSAFPCLYLARSRWLRMLPLLVLDQ